MPKLLSVFIDNRPGRLESVTKILTEQNINIRAFTIQDRGDSGLMKMFVDKSEDAHLILADRGFACALKEVLVISVPDKPGNLHRLTAIMTENSVNIADVFGFILEPDQRGLCCMEIKEPISKSVRESLVESGFTILTDVDVNQL